MREKEEGFKKQKEERREKPISKQNEYKKQNNNNQGKKDERMKPLQILHTTDILPSLPPLKLNWSKQVLVYMPGMQTGSLVFTHCRGGQGEGQITKGTQTDR